ncbi:helix-turn-helix transcriptional regulator [Parabacteroides merdae]|uniref:helix-turn-helix transcriptional regulator n=1 Tax=Parabacteroides merdae TaxID=46503 RepID=UPI003F9BC753
MKSEYQNYIINKIRRLREERQYSQENIATLLGLCNGHIGNIESPKTSHKYTLSHIFKICNEFNYPIEQIFLEDEDYKTNIDIVSNIIKKIIRYEEQRTDY